jgi:hypothetical protein
MSTHHEKLRVGVILGGMSSEREISLESGRNIYYNLDPSKYEGVPIFLDTEGRLWEITLPLLVQNTTEDIVARLDEATRIPYEALKDRIEDAGAKMLITADGGHRGGKIIELKAAADKHGYTVEREDARLAMYIYLSDTREQAWADVEDAIQRDVHDYFFVINNENLA